MSKTFLTNQVGNTPLIYIRSLSEITGNHIWGKAEFMNPGGSIKDRAAKYIIEKAEQRGDLKPGYTIYEGTAGNTGIGLSMLAAQRKYKTVIVMPNNQAKEKYDTLMALGAELIKVDPCPFANQNHFYHTARRLSEQNANSFWANQFENTDNFLAHYESTGPEIWKDLKGAVDVFICSAGTGGSIAGISSFLKEKNSSIICLLADPLGSGLYSYIKTNEIKSTGSSITEGIGIMRITQNFSKAKIDDAVQINDSQMLETLFYLSKNEGLFLGTSAALNVRAAFEYSKAHLGQKKNIVTLLCDSGSRYASKIFNDEWLKSQNLTYQIWTPREDVSKS